MAFNKGYELKKFEAHWEKLRIEYAAAGMAEDAIQKMYDYDRQQFNSERTRIERTQEFTAPAYESTEEEASPLMLRYQEAITTTDTYHETKRSFAWIGEIEDENADLYDSASFEAKKMIVSQLIRRVDVYRGYQIHVDFNFDLAQYLENSDELAC